MTRRLTLLLMWVASVTALLGVGTNSATAQSSRIHHRVSSDSKDVPTLGRDLWFAVPQNYDRSQDPTRYFYIYISSSRNTTAHIQIGAASPILRPVTANQTTVVSSIAGDFSKQVELQSSGIKETKTIHVWSTDADLSVYFLSRAPFTTDGMYVIPTIGWGTDYVVGSYSSFLIDVKIIDLPSEFVIVASQDNTNVFITPSADIRQDGFPGIVEHPKGQQFTITLNKGESVEYQTTATPLDESYDFSGTHISSSKPVGVIGASVCPNITPADNSCDHVLDMIPPTRIWSNTYFSAPFAGKTYGGDGFLIVGSKPGQVIYRNGVQAAILGAQYSANYVYDISNPSLWTSDTSFMMVQYIMSASHGVPNNGLRNTGDPAMVVINPADQFGNRIIFQVPQLGGTLGGGQNDFVNYLNIFVPVTHENATTMDGKKLGAIPFTSVRKFLVPNTGWEILQLKYTQAGAGAGNHLIVSDTGVGVYLYGYTTDDSYAWAGALGIRSTASPDTLPPIVDTTGACYCAHITLRDNRPIDTKINSYSVDSIQNFTLTKDPNFIDGNGTDSTYYDICVTDSTKEAYISLTAFDLAGNATTVESFYKPAAVDFEPCPFTLNSPSVGVTVSDYDTLYNLGATGDDAFNFIGANLALLKGTVGFTIDSVGADGPILPGGFRVIKISFTAKVTTGVSDTIQIFDGCQFARCTLLGLGGASSFAVSNLDFGCVIPDSTGYAVCNITNPSKGNVTITSITVDDNVHYKYDQTIPGNALPLVVVPKNTQATTPVTFTFTPTTTGPLPSTIARFYSPDVPTDTILATIDGKGCKPAYLITPDTLLTDCNTPVTAHVTFENIGSYFDSLLTISHSDNKHFIAPVLEDGVGNVYTLPMRISEGQSFTVDVGYSPAAKTSGCYTDTIFMVSVYGDTLRGYATVCDAYRDAQLSRGNLNAGTLAVGGSVVLDSFILCNNGKDPLTVSRIDQFTSRDSAQFKLTGAMNIGGTPTNFPVVLLKGDCLTIYVQFDPAVLDTAQLGLFGIISNACSQTTHQNLQAQILGATAVGPPTILGFTTPTILSCGGYDSVVTITNSKPVDKQIVGLSFSVPPTGTATTFTTLVTLPLLLAANSSVSIPVHFSPTPSVAMTNYISTVTADVIDLGQTDTLAITTQVNASASYFDLSFNHSFTKNIVHAGDLVSMPIALALQKNGLSEPLSTLDVQKIVLKYTYDIDLLDVYDFTNVFTTSIPGWTVDQANTSIDVPTKTLTLTLMGPATAPLSDATTELGMVNFKVLLPKVGNNTTVNLTSSSIYDGTNTQIPSCMALAHQDTSVTLVLQCGDSTLRLYMNGDDPIVRIIPAVPNPVTSAAGSVTLSYALRLEGDVTLSIFDALGKQVTRLLDHVHHPAGQFEVLYNTSTLPAGSYIYRLEYGLGLIRSGRFVVEH